MKRWDDHKQLWSTLPLLALLTSWCEKARATFRACLLSRGPSLSPPESTKDSMIHSRLLNVNPASRTKCYVQSNNRTTTLAKSCSSDLETSALYITWWWLTCRVSYHKVLLLMFLLLLWNWDPKEVNLLNSYGKLNPISKLFTSQFFHYYHFLIL